MSYASDLLSLAERLASQDGDDPNQAELRRSVSTSYYALFHLLISEATMNYAQASLRPEFGRVFEDGRMKSAAVQRRAAMQNRVDDTAAQRLYLVADTFIEAQAKRMIADYHMGREWRAAEALEMAQKVEAAFAAWQEIRESAEAQSFLIAMPGARAGA